MSTADLVAPQATEGAETSAPPVTALEAEELVRDLDRRRAEVAERYRQHELAKPPQIDRVWSQTMREISDAGLELDRQRAAARKLARELKEREASRAAWQAWHAVYPEHLELCRQIADALDAAIRLLEGERTMHDRLREAAGRSMLPDLRADLEALRRLQRSAAIAGRPSKEGVQ